MKSLFAPFMLAAVLFFAGLAATAAELPDDMTRFFNGYKACFVLLDVEKNAYHRFNPEQCAVRLPPCSTFKIFNSLAGLDCGVLSGPDHLMKWDGQKRDMEAWNKDHTLQSAVRDSVVWYFQRVAEQIGAERMQKYINAVDYGNKDISGGITRFWLGNSLQISADEQVEFVRKLYLNKLPFSQNAMDTVKKIIVVEENPHSVLRGKTGSDFQDGKWTLGWFVGYVVHDGHPYVFATNIQSGQDAKGPTAREITKNILRKQGLL